MKKKTLYFISILVLFFGCKKELQFPRAGAQNMKEIFDEFWIKMNLQYVYWDRDVTDWDAVYSKYEPLFKKLTNSPEDTRTGFKYLKEMTSGLIDGHFRIVFSNEILKDSVICPSLSSKTTQESYHPPFVYPDVVKNYLDHDFLDVKGTVVRNGTRIRVVLGKINSSIVYFNLNFFAAKEAYYSDGVMKNMLDRLFSEIENSQKINKGLIIDLRSNMGGDLQDLDFLAGKLINNDLVFGYTRNKTGMGKLTYFPWLASKIKHDPKYNFNLPILILTDSFTASLSETLAIALRNKSNCFIIGERTYGATGPISDPKVFNSGSFKIGNFADIETSSLEFISLDGASFEGVGIKPDMIVPFNYSALLRGIDRPLEEAIKKINSDGL